MNFVRNENKFNGLMFVMYIRFSKKHVKNLVKIKQVNHAGGCKIALGNKMASKLVFLEWSSQLLL